jgi:hypothetical protein
MAYWVKRVLLKTGEVVTERELPSDENLFQGQSPVVGDKITVTCRGGSFEARVIWGNWQGRNEGRGPDVVVSLRVEEI